MEIGIGIVSVCQLFGPKRILEHLVDEQTAAAHAVELIDKIDKFLVGKIEVVEIDIQAGTIVGTKLLPGILQEEGGLAHASAALDTDEPVRPVDFLHKPSLDGRVYMFDEVFVGFKKSLHLYCL